MLIFTMAWEIDQSGRIEETNRDTVIAIANKQNSYTLKINARTKRALEKDYRLIGKPKMFKVKTFSYGIVYLIKKSNIKESYLILDVEYPGYENMIKDLIKNRFRRDFIIRFTSIGKSSPAHEAAYFTYKKKRKADFALNYEEFIKTFGSAS